MAEALAWDGDNIVHRYSVPLHVERRTFNLEASKPPLVVGDDGAKSMEHSRSPSAKRADIM